MSARQEFYGDIARQCLASRQQRFEMYKACRNYYLFGTIDESGTPYNKIKPALKTYTSFLYSPDGVRFVLSVGTTAGNDDIARAVPLQNEITQQWKMSHTHLLFKKAVTWSLVFGCMIVKVQWMHGVARTWLVEPHQFGVLREDVTSLDDQEAYCMCYTMTRSALEQMLKDDPRRDSLMMRIGSHTGGGENGFGDGMSRLLLSNPVAGVAGSRALQSGPIGGPGGTTDQGLGGGGATDYNYSPQVSAELIDMRELYVWNDDTEDYQIVTMAAPHVMIYDRPQARMGVGGMPNFAKVVADDDLYDYFWGSSWVADLAGLQDWRTEDVYNVRNLQRKQSNPAISGSSMGGITDEKLGALRNPGGRLAISGDPNAKITVHTPSLPENIFATEQEIDNMFNDSSGISHVMQGRGESGVRSKGQADVLARLGSARVKATAISVEESAEDVATIMFRTMQENSTQRFQTETEDESPGMQFTAHQFTTDFELKVDAHSSSPIFVEDHRAEADNMLERRIIDRETWIEMVNPPNAQRLKQRLKKIEKQEAEAQKMKMQMEMQKHGGGRPAE